MINRWVLVARHTQKYQGGSDQGRAGPGCPEWVRARSRGQRWGKALVSAGRRSPQPPAGYGEVVEMEPQHGLCEM